MVSPIAKAKVQYVRLRFARCHAFTGLLLIRGHWVDSFVISFTPTRMSI